MRIDDGDRRHHVTISRTELSSCSTCTGRPLPYQYRADGFCATDFLHGILAERDISRE